MATGERLFARVSVDEGGSRMAAVSMAATRDFAEGAMDTAIITDTDTAVWCLGTAMESRITIRIALLRITAPQRTAITLLRPMTHTLSSRITRPTSRLTHQSRTVR